MINVPETMRAVLLTGHGGPERLEYREDVPTPIPAPAEVLVRVSACGINNTDIWVREGAYGSEDDPGAVSSWRRDQSLEFPVIQGADIAGRIAAVGDGVDGGIVGKRVMVDFGIYNDPGPSLANVDYIGHGRNGGFAEYCAVPAENAHIVETPLSDVELATFCCAYVTAERMLARAHVTGGETVLVTGASGGRGHRTHPARESPRRGPGRRRQRPLDGCPAGARRTGGHRTRVGRPRRCDLLDAGRASRRRSRRRSRRTAVQDPAQHPASRRSLCNCGRHRGSARRARSAHRVPEAPRPHRLDAKARGRTSPACATSRLPERSGRCSPRPILSRTSPAPRPIS